MWIKNSGAIVGKCNVSSQSSEICMVKFPRTVYNKTLCMNVLYLQDKLWKKGNQTFTNDYILSDKQILNMTDFHSIENWIRRLEGGGVRQEKMRKK